MDGDDDLDGGLDGKHDNGYGNCMDDDSNGSIQEDDRGTTRPGVIRRLNVVMII